MLQNLHYRRPIPNSLTDTGHDLGTATDVSVTKAQYFYIRNLAVMIQAFMMQVLHAKKMFAIISARRCQSTEVSVRFRRKVSVTSFHFNLILKWELI